MTSRFAAVRTVPLLAAVALTLGPAPGAAQLVERVVDGDTIIVQGVGRVRLIGVDTPETVDPRRPVECFGKEASAFTKRLLEGQHVRGWSTTGTAPTATGARWPTSTSRTARSPTRRSSGRGYGHAYTRFPFRYLDEFRQYEREARQGERGLWGATCADAPSGRAASRPSATRRSGGSGALQRYDDNGNGRITCAEARRHGIAPVPRGHPAYPYMRDADGDGVVCE